jgi:hypothetical protein
MRFSRASVLKLAPFPLRSVPTYKSWSKEAGITMLTVGQARCGQEAQRRAPATARRHPRAPLEPRLAPPAPQTPQRRRSRRAEAVEAAQAWPSEPVACAQQRGTNAIVERGRQGACLYAPAQRKPPLCVGQEAVGRGRAAVFRKRHPGTGFHRQPGTPHLVVTQPPLSARISKVVIFASEGLRAAAGSTNSCVCVRACVVCAHRASACAGRVAQMAQRRCIQTCVHGPAFDTFVPCVLLSLFSCHSAQIT